MPEIHPKRVRIGGRYWKLVSAKIPGHDGLAENDWRTKHKHIWINSATTGKDLLDTLIHEITHCYAPHWSEDAVTQFASELATVLWDLGYRAVELGDED